MGKFTNTTVDAVYYDPDVYGSVDRLLEYRKLGIPLMPKQIRYLRANGISCSKDAMLGRSAKDMEGL